MSARSNHDPQATTGRRVLAWVVWIALAVAAGAGLRHFAVDNALDAWMPERAGAGPMRSYVVVGFDRSEIAEHELAGALRAAEGVARCLDPQTIRRSEPLTGIRSEGLTEGADGVYAGIYCLPAPGIADEALLGAVRAALEERGVLDRVQLGGPAVFHVALNRASQSRLAAITAAIAVLGTLLLWLLTRRPVAALAATGAVVISQIVLVGAIAWSQRPMDMSLSMVPPLMMSLGYSYAAHRLMRRDVTRRLLWCGGTTAAGFAFFGICDLPPVRAFALWGVVGLAMVWIAVVTLVPPPRAERRRRPMLARRVPPPALTVGAAVVISILAVAAAPHLRFATDPLLYFPRDDPVVTDFAILNERLTGMLPFELRVDGDADPSAQVAASPGVRAVVDLSALDPASEGVLWCLADNDAVPALQAHARAWQAWGQARETRIEFGGVAAQLATVGRTVRRVAVLSLPCMALVAAISIWVQTRRLSLALLSAWVNALPILALVILATALRLPLSIPALLIGAIGMGVAIDDTVHITAETIRRRSVRRALVRCAAPCLASSLVVCACMLLFTASDFAPTAQFGGLMAAAVAAAAIGDLLVLPAAMGRGARRA